ncbi:MFS transporter [Youngiibacter multivorans]|uniref:PPP family 3-phenylpropionic acid transporter n=1 Tax=Youngiibacter multivorans TaxID=937251 RepID=A0ABS4G6L6_9CLOT|nr:MFS transporter [Youngiibacter multivorans]MBP1920218.1 PPP family 3-phenylpropionic acid transporter [Youngiibacter multivorans]
MKKKDVLTTNLKLSYFLIFGSFACFFPFLTYYMQSRGLSFTQIGILFAVYSITGVFTQPIWGFLTDKYLNKRITIMILIIGSAILITSFIFANSFIAILLSIVLFLTFQSPIIPVSDAFTYEIMEKKREIQYGRIRLMGSAGYAFMALISGQVVSRVGINVAFIMYSVMIMVGLIFIYRIDFQGKKTKVKINVKDISKLFRNRRFLIFMLAVYTINIAIGSNNSYISLLIQKTGGTVAHIGVYGFMVAISELPSMFSGHKLMKRFGELNLFAIGIFFFVLRYLLDSLSVSYQMVLVVQVLQGVSFALFFMAALQYLNGIVPSAMKTTAMTIFAAVCGLGNFTGNIGGGILLEHIDIFTLFRILAAVSFVALLIILGLKVYEKSLKEKLVS